MLLVYLCLEKGLWLIMFCWFLHFGLLGLLLACDFWASIHFELKVVSLLWWVQPNITILFTIISVVLTDQPGIHPRITILLSHKVCQHPCFRHLFCWIWFLYFKCMEWFGVLWTLWESIEDELTSWLSLLISALHILLEAQPTVQHHHITGMEVMCFISQPTKCRYKQNRDACTCLDGVRRKRVRILCGDIM